jgi:hypothetical protein
MPRWWSYEGCRSCVALGSALPDADVLLIGALALGHHIP